jgi:hypothetical protein
MRLDLTDPASVADWYRIAPKRHAAMLRHWLASQFYAEFHSAIVASRELIK